jgi:hypothetical protein
MAAIIHSLLKSNSNVRPLFNFKLEILDEMDTVYFAHCYPYTYSDLCDLI